VSFQSLVYSGEKRKHGSGGLTATLSLIVHVALIAVMIIVPVLLDDFLPDPDRTVRAFFVSPTGIAPPPPPPPPPAAGARKVTRAPAVPRPAEAPRFVAPVEVPDEIVPESGIDLGVEGGVPGGVEGGVAGGVVGGIVGGLPEEVKAEPKYVRVGGNIKAPKLVHEAKPEYPMLAQQARVQGFVILEARVGVDGRVQNVRVLRSIPLLDEAAVAAVQQWRYQPLLLNGTPMPFVLTVTVVFKIAQ
jgi:protein TonB